MDKTKQTKKGKQEKPEFMVDLFDKYSKSKICDIPKTNTKKEVNTFASYRPKPGYCLDYDISQTDAKLDAGNTKIKIKQTKASYVPVPPEDLPVEKPKRERKIVYSHAGPPCWEFIDERYRREQEVLQQQYREDLKRRRRERLKAERKERRYKNKDERDIF